jgi:tetratricopeptide (TPR) repeat protein
MQILRGVVLDQIGFTDQGGHMVARGVSLVSRHGNDMQRFEGALRAAHLWFERGMPRRAESAFGESVQEAHTFGSEWLTVALPWWAWGLFWTGDITQAVEVCDRHVRLSSKLGARNYLALERFVYSDGMSSIGRYEEALSAADSQVELMIHEIPQFEQTARYQRARALLGLGRLDEADAEAANALALCPPGADGWYWRIKCRALRLVIGAALPKSWPSAEASAVTEELLATRRLLWASELLCARAKREEDPSLARRAAETARDIGAPMAAARAAAAGHLWTEPIGAEVKAMLEGMKAHLPRPWLADWSNLPEVATGLVRSDFVAGSR